MKYLSSTSIESSVPKQFQNYLQILSNSNPPEVKLHPNFYQEYHNEVQVELRESSSEVL